MFKIGYLPLSKVNWTNDTLEAARANATAFLKTLPDVEVIAPDHMLALEGEAIEVLDQWEKDRPDLIVAHFLTFSLGVVPPMFAQRLKVPILLWSQPEPDPKGGRLQNNSFCAANMNAHHMWRLGIPYFYVHAQAGTKEAETSCVDEMMLRRTLGPEVKIITEHELFTVAKNLTADEVAKGIAIIDEDLKTPSADAPRGDQKEKSARLIAAVMKLKEKFFVDTFAMRCWPEVILSEFYGIAVCSTLGHLTNHGYLTACEGDVYGAVMMRIGQIISGELPFFCDLIICEGDHGTVWHCGAAPCGLAKPGCTPELHCSATVEGGGVKGCTGEFPLKPGRVTLARLGETRDGRGFRMLVCPGTGIDTDLFVRGTPLNVKFDAGCEAIRREVMENGWEHHYALMYGDRVDELTAFCRNMNIEMHLVK